MRQTARRHAISVVRPSPARAEAPEPDVWIPILDLDVLEALGSQVDPVLARELDGLELRFVDVPGPGRSRMRTSLVAPVRLVPAPAVPAELDLAPPVAVTQHDDAPAPPRLGTGLATGQLHHRFMHWVILAVALGIVVAGVPYFLRSPAQRRVTLDVDGTSLTRTTRLDHVAGLLAAAGVAVAPGDRVTPAPSAALGNGTTVRVVRAFPVTVDIDGSVRSVRTTATTLHALRRELKVPAVMVAVGAPDRLRRDEAVVFRTPFDLTLITDGVAGTLTSTARTVGELLAERRVLFVAGDQIDPALDVPLSAGLAITVTHTTAGRVTEDTSVPFEVQEHADASLPEGQRHVVQNGVDGTDRVTYQLTRDGDLVVGKQALGTVRVRAAQPEIVAVGTQAIGDSEHQSGRATWYATLYQPGTCAHLRIPFGTIVRVVDTDTGASTTCRVADRGPEAYTGNIIDLSPDVFEQLQPLSVGLINVRLEY